MSQGPRTSVKKMVPGVYAEMRKIAGNLFRGEKSGHTLQPTALVNEAMIRLLEATGLPGDQKHLIALSAQMMRRILIDHARAKCACKRMGKLERVELDDVAQPTVEGMSDEMLIAIDCALEKLGKIDERKANVVIMRSFGGYELDEIAKSLDSSLATIKRDWVFARAWLHTELGGTP